MPIVHRTGKEAHAGVEKRGVDAVQIHVGDPLMRTEPARATLLVAHRLCRDHTLPRANAADPTHTLLAAEDLLLDEQPLLAVLVLDEFGRPVAEGRVQVVVP